MLKGNFCVISSATFSLQYSIPPLWIWLHKLFLLLILACIRTLLSSTTTKTMSSSVSCLFSSAFISCDESGCTRGSCGRLSRALSGVLLDKYAAVVIPWAALPPTRCCGRRGDRRAKRGGGSEWLGGRRAELQLSHCYVMQLLCSVCLLEVTLFGLILSNVMILCPRIEVARTANKAVYI